MMFVKHYVKELPNKGTGVFSSEFIPKGTLIWKLTKSKSYNRFEWEQLPEDLKKEAYPDSDGNFIVAEGKEESWNHSCNANTWWKSDNELSARFDINKDEEITYDYATTDIDENPLNNEEYPWICVCGQPNCRKILHWNDILKPEIYKLYEGHLPSWVEKFVSQNIKI